MAKHVKVFDDAFNQALGDAFESVLAEQPWVMRRKDSLTAALGTVLQVLNLLVMLAGEWPLWAHIALGGAIGIVQIGIHALTPGSVTPSQQARIREAAPSIKLPGPAEPQDALNMLAGIVEAVNSHRRREFGTEGFGSDATHAEAGSSIDNLRRSGAQPVGDV
ncbi:hypothetical protein CMUST_15670 (plasmid) [Corynebacterium mustelae]|uniref:Uncharacterized protein n=1 Tax=Corynebacterium mustelae TaxID=571915 RepID=A0A0G3H2E0_9CORY|nr:hypothetical protein [Corynebacterium mustelae]AKK05252.1 hypothetical protein CMUST_04550 [Corynebacterium mustelae]AKK07422.1 hypothetical protein CMUST_15670 [Corynebacterium mustelae]